MHDNNTLPGVYSGLLYAALGSDMWYDAHEYDDEEGESSVQEAQVDGQVEMSSAGEVVTLLVALRCLQSEMDRDPDVLGSFPHFDDVAGTPSIDDIDDLAGKVNSSVLQALVSPQNPYRVEDAEISFLTWDGERGTDKVGGHYSSHQAFIAQLMGSSLAEGRMLESIEGIGFEEGCAVQIGEDTVALAPTRGASVDVVAGPRRVQVVNQGEGASVYFSKTLDNSCESISESWCLFSDARPGPMGLDQALQDLEKEPDFKLYTVEVGMFNLENDPETPFETIEVLVAGDDAALASGLAQSVAEGSIATVSGVAFSVTRTAEEVDPAHYQSGQDA